MDVAVQRQERLPLFDKPAHSDAADMKIQGNVVDHFAVLGRSIQLRFVGRTVEQEYRALQRSSSRQ
jgi:hypothetical protein